MKYLWILIYLFSLNSIAQSTVKSFATLSSPEKWWVVMHPFKAKKALDISMDVLKTTDSIAKLDLLDNDFNGGQLDAFKHSYWSARLSNGIGESAALKLGDAHEKGNYQSFKKRQLEDGSVPDKVSSAMDLFNNEIGAKIVNNNEEVTNQKLIQLVFIEINKGNMRIIKKDKKGNFLTCDGEVIPRKTLLGTWENNKCLIASNKKL